MFCLDERIQSTCIVLDDWPLSRVLLKNERNYPWFILVPRKEKVREIHQLKQEERYLLIDEIHQLSQFVADYFKPDKLNTGALGNIVSQLHIHVIARTTSDPLWPHGIWQESFQPDLYEDEYLKSTLPVLQAKVIGVGKRLLIKK